MERGVSIRHLMSGYRAYYGRGLAGVLWGAVLSCAVVLCAEVWYDKVVYVEAHPQHGLCWYDSVSASYAHQFTLGKSPQGTKGPL